MGRAGPKGKGLFAKAPIPPGAVVAGYRGAPKWIWDIPEPDWPYTFQVGYDRYILPGVRNAGRYVNHSCEPNCVVSGRSIVTRRAVGAGEELTFDYSTDIDWPGFRMNCECGSPKCRKVVRAYRFLPRRLKLEYGGCVADYISRMYAKSLHPLQGRGQRK